MSTRKQSAPAKRLGRPPTIENARARILVHAAGLFAEKGYEATSLNDLAECLGLTKPAVYNYFRSKQDLYDAVILETLSGLLDHVRTSVEANGSPPTRLKAFMTAHARYFAGHRDGFATMLVGFGGMQNLEFRNDAMGLRQSYEALLGSILDEGVAGKSFRDVDPRVATRAVLSLLNWMVRWFRPDGPQTAEQLAMEYYNLLALERQDLNGTD